MAITTTMVMPKIEREAVARNYGKFVISPLESGYVLTLGSAMRRVLLSSLEGAAVTNTAAVGGAGISLALKLLQEEKIETDASAPQPNTVLLVPVVAADDNDDGRATLESWLVEGLDPTWPLGLTIEGWTTYTPEQAIDCKGPGDE